MGTQVTIAGRNPFLLSGEEREISVLARKVMSGYMDIWTNHEIVEIEDAGDGQKKQWRVIEIQETTKRL